MFYIFSVLEQIRLGILKYFLLDVYRLYINNNYFRNYGILSVIVLIDGH